MGQPTSRASATTSRELSRGLVGVGVDPIPVVAVVRGRVDRDQLLHRTEVVDEELAVEVVELVLERPTEQAAAGDLDLLAVTVLGDDPDLLLAGDVGVVAGEGEAALEVAVLAAAPDDPGVHQLVQLVADLDDARLQRLADLRRGQADARGVAHGVGQVVEQPVEEPTEAVDRLTFQPEPGAAEEDDGANAHGPRVYRRLAGRPRTPSRTCARGGRYSRGPSAGS